MALDFIPHSEGELVIWLNNFKSKITTAPALAGLTAADAASVAANIDKLLLQISNTDTQQTLLNSMIATKKSLKHDTIEELRGIANQIKNLTGYTTSTGQLFQIVPVTPTPQDPTTAKPALSVVFTGGHIVVSFVKGSSNGVKIYSKRGNETEFTFLAIDTHSPYHDNRDNLVANSTETRQYYAVFIDKNDAVYGVQSDIVQMTI